jgi:hypothetical protein
VTQYQRGTALEYSVIKAYRLNGWFVQRSSGSHGPVDVIAMDPEFTVCIQCKRNDSDVESAMAEMRAKVPKGPGRILAVWTGTPRHPAMSAREDWWELT